MAGQKLSDRYATHKLGTGSGAAAVAADDLLLIQDTSEETANDQVKVVRVDDVVKDYFGAAIGKNLFNKADINSGKYVLIGGGLGNNAATNATNYIAVTPGQVIAFSAVGSGAGFYTAFYDSGLTFVAASQITNTALVAAGNKVTVPAGAAYMRHTIYNANLSTFMDTLQIEVGWTTAYETYETGLARTKLVLSEAEARRTGDKLSVQYTDNVKYYGAKGDGTTNDTNAFVTALANCGKTLFIPDGTYLLSGITIAANKLVSLVGESQDGTILQLVTATVATVPLITLAAGVNSISISNLTLKHRATGFTPSGDTDGNLIYFTSDNYFISIHRVTFTTFSNYAINVNDLDAGAGTAARPTRITDCVFYNGSRPAIYFHDGVEYVLIANNHFRQVAGCLYAVGAGATNNNTFRNNICVTCGSATYPVIYSEAGRLSIINNTINHNVAEVISLAATTSGAGQHIIMGNHIVQLDGSAGVKAVYLHGCSFCLVTGNYIDSVSGKPCLVIDDNSAVYPNENVVTSNIFDGGEVTQTHSGTGNVYEHNIET
jgi:hypothetical protein